MNTSYKCNCCAKKSVCKYSEEYKQDCGAILSAICGKTTEVRIVCSEFAPVAADRQGGGAMTQAKDIETYAEYRIILVEDGSVDTDECKELGFRPLVYRKGAALPMILKGDKT